MYSFNTDQSTAVHYLINEAESNINVTVLVSTISKESEALMRPLHTKFREIRHNCNFTTAFQGKLSKLEHSDQ